MKLLTTDIYEGAYLLSQGMSLEKLWQRTDTKRGIVFEFSGEIVFLLRDKYQLGAATANIMKYRQCLDDLKDKMFGVIRETEKEKKTYEHIQSELVTK